MPNLSIVEAVMTGVIIAGLYVSFLYMVPEEVAKLPRDDGIHICFRGMAVLAASLLSTIPLAVLVNDGFENTSTIKLLGYGSACIESVHAWMPFVSVAVLFLGPTVAWTLEWIMTRAKKNDGASGFWAPGLLSRLNMVTVRALVIAPVAEEWVFRACLLPLFAIAGAGPVVSIAWCCSLFALAHSHHYWDLCKRMSHEAAIATLALQLAYTFLFGAFAGWVFWRTGSVLVTIACHALCNFFGLPDVSFMRKHGALYGYRWAIATAHAAGIAGFVWILMNSSTWGGRAAFPCALAFGIP